jgi:hypothetical protein
MNVMKMVIILINIKKTTRDISLFVHWVGMVRSRMTALGEESDARLSVTCGLGNSALLCTVVLRLQEALVATRQRQVVVATCDR